MTGLHEAELASLNALVGATLGLHFPPARWELLERKASAAAADLGLADARALLNRLRATPFSQPQVDLLAAHLTVSETYFWREPRALEALRDTILPILFAERRAGERTLRVWCAGCSTGEEAYSLAIVLTEAIPAGEKWQITLLATDINAEALRYAALGVYGAWSFRHAPPELQTRYFERRSDGQFAVLPALRSMVTFAYHNLAEATYPARHTNTQALDIICCRNVLMYLGMERGRQAAQRFHQALVPGGWLLPAAAELSEQRFSHFTPVQFPGAFLYRRDDWPPFLAVTAPLAAAVPPLLTQPLLSLTVAPPPIVPVRPPAAVAQPAALDPEADWAALARRLANQGQLAEARTACERALAIDKLDASLHYLHAVILAECHLEELAKVALRRALYLDPNFVLAHFTLGKLAQQQRAATMAHKSFLHALALLGRLDPNDSLPEGEGLTAGRLSEIVTVALQTGAISL